MLPSPLESVEVPFTVSDAHDGVRLDAFLTARLRRYSRAEVQRLIAEGRVSLRGASPKRAATVAEGDLVVVRYPRVYDAPSRHERLDVLFEDGHLLAVDKPGDVLSHPTDKALANTVTALLSRQFPGVRLRLAHRLDRETSGVLLLSKTAEAARALTGQFERGAVRKEYLAVLRGRLRARRIEIDAPLGPEGGEIKVRQAVLPPGRGAPARTVFEVLDASREASLARALPASGRLHQIRAHAAALGHPVLGDKLYGGDGSAYLRACRKELSPEDLAALGAPRQLLHARALRLAHPIHGGQIEISCAPPADFRRRLDELGLRFRP